MGNICEVGDETIENREIEAKIRLLCYTRDIAFEYVDDGKS
jgi:hypothetical protein